MHMKNTSPQYGLFCCFYKVQLYRKISWYDSFILSYIWLLQNCRKNMREKNREEKSEKKKSTNLKLINYSSNAFQ